MSHELHIIDILAVLPIVSVPVAIMVAVIREVRKTFKAQDRRSLENKQWLKKEMKKRKYRIVFITNDKLKKVHRSSIYYPAVDIWSFDWTIKHTSKYLANNGLAVSYKNGFFTDDKGITYPACNIAKAFIA